MQLISRAIATGLFVGYTPVMPGTAGSLVGIILYWLIPGSDSLYALPVILAVGLLGVWSAEKVETETQKNDNQVIVIDEIVGMFVTVFLFKKELIWLAFGFVLFRLFDILKLPPAKQMERLHGGWGIMLDDIVAGIYSAVSLRLLHYLW